eukprot:COSAG06_NODE_842_length_11986_cov_54.409355_14_plen_110_part_00
MVLEQGKVVSASARRIRSLSSDDKALLVNVSLALRESSRFTVIWRGGGGGGEGHASETPLPQPQPSQPQQRDWSVECVAGERAATHVGRWDASVEMAVWCTLLSGCSCE